MGGEIIFKACPTTALLHSENPTAPHHRRHHGWVAQSAEQWTENPRVGGSIPPPARLLKSRRVPQILQLVNLPKYAAKKWHQLGVEEH